MTNPSRENISARPSRHPYARMPTSDGRSAFKINYTHCLMAFSPTAMAEVESILEGTSKEIWHLPNAFPRAGLHAPPEEPGLNIPIV